MLLVSCQGNPNEIPSHIYPNLNSKIQYQEDWQKKFYDKRIKEFKESPIGYNQIVLLGNSITEDAKGWNDSLGITNITNRGISGDSELITYCGSVGTLSGLAYYALKSAGLPNAKLYVRSFKEWKNLQKPTEKQEDASYWDLSAE